MKANIAETRWELLQVSVKDGNFTILDNAIKKKRTYHVPNLLRVEIAQQAAYVFTANGKVMHLNLLTATRNFLSTSAYEGDSKTPRQHQPLHLKDMSSIVNRPSLSTSTNFSELAFSNTVYM